MAALSEWAKENKRRRTREWYAKAKAEGRLKPKANSRKSRAKEFLTDEQQQRMRIYRKRWDAKRSKAFNSWRAMHKRCSDPNHNSYKWYGAKGVTVCDRWQCYEKFIEDMGQRPDGKTLDRIDPCGNYEKGNCRWATPKEQAANKRNIKTG